MHIIQFPLETTGSDETTLAARFWIIWKIHNLAVAEGKKRIRLLFRMPEFIRIRREYGKLKEELKAEKKRDVIHEKRKRLKFLSEEMDACREKIGLTKSGIEKYVKLQQHKYSKDISSQQAQKEADRVWSGIEKVLFGNGEGLHFKRYHEIHTISQKCATNGVKYDPGKEIIIWRGISIPVKINHKDPYIQETLSHSVRLCEIKRIEFSSGYRYYVILYLDGTAPVKAKNRHGSSLAGIDPGTSTVACVSEKTALLEELAPESIKYEKKIRILQKQVDHLVRCHNPNNYDESGRVRKGRKKWQLSKRCRHLKRQIRVLYRKQTDYIYTSHHNLINRILRDSGTIIIEPMEFSSLQKRAKKTERQEEASAIVKKDGSVQMVHKYKRKKRFGHSIKNRSPGLFVRDLRNKCIQQDVPFYEINRSQYKASQYDHTTGEYVKVPLSQRTKQINDHMIQRDLYSAWLIRNTDVTLCHPNDQLCINTFDQFVSLHDKCIESMHSENISFRACFGF